MKRNYVLYVNESVGDDYRRYSYHLQKDDKMVRRWDNAPHGVAIRTFPFHLHIPAKDKPIECKAVFINDVLWEIRDIIAVG